MTDREVLQACVRMAKEGRWMRDVANGLNHATGMSAHCAVGMVALLTNDATDCAGWCGDQFHRVMAKLEAAIPADYVFPRCGEMVNGGTSRGAGGIGPVMTYSNCAKDVEEIISWFERALAGETVVNGPMAALAVAE